MAQTQAGISRVTPDLTWILLPYASAVNASEAAGTLAQKQKGRLAAAIPRVLLATACALRFLRQPNKPSAPRPEAKSGRAAGSGVVATGAMLNVASIVMFSISSNGSRWTINSGIVRVRTSPARLSVTGEGKLSAPNVTVAPAE